MLLWNCPCNYQHPPPPTQGPKGNVALGGKESSTQSVTLILLAFLAVDVNFVVFCRKKKKIATLPEYTASEHFSCLPISHSTSPPWPTHNSSRTHIHCRVRSGYKMKYLFPPNTTPFQIMDNEARSVITEGVWKVNYWNNLKNSGDCNEYNSLYSCQNHSECDKHLTFANPDAAPKEVSY